MLSTLCDGMTIERDGNIISSHGDSGEEAKCILIVVVNGIALLDGIESLGNLFIRGIFDVNVVRTEDYIVAESEMIVFISYQL